MRVTGRTRTKDIIPLLADKDRFDRFMADIPEYPLEKNILSMTVGEFFEATEPSYIDSIMAEKRALKAFGKLKSYKRQMEAVSRFINQNSFKMTPEENQAQTGVVFPDFRSRVLMDLARFFSLKSLDEAENIPFSNWLIINQQKTADAKFERNLHRIYSIKTKKKR